MYSTYFFICPFYNTYFLSIPFTTPISYLSLLYNMSKYRTR